MRFALFALVLLASRAWLACGPDRAAFERARAAHDAGAGVTASSIVADEIAVVGGVPDRGRDPAVVGVGAGGHAICTGVLVSPRLVLTARHCVSRVPPVIGCPATAPQVLEERPLASLVVLGGEDAMTAKRLAGVAAVVIPDGDAICDADVALLVLDQEIDDIKPAALATESPAVGDRIRSVGFGRPRDEDPAGQKLVREHVRVLAVGDAELTVGEAACQGNSGGPAVDEETGAVVGVVSRSGARCDSPDGGDDDSTAVHNVYTRVDAFGSLTERAFTQAAQLTAEELGVTDPTAVKPAKRGSKTKPPSDVGTGCKVASDCAAGVCMADGYCSRPCGSGDRCPLRFHCALVSAVGALPAPSACVSVP